MEIRRSRRSTLIQNEIVWRGRAFQCVHDVTRKDLLRILKGWKQGGISSEDVATFGEVLVEWSGGLPDYRRENPASVVVGVISLLDSLYSQPVYPEDIPAMVRFLTRGADNPVSAWAELDTCWEQVDWETRVSEDYPE